MPKILKPNNSDYRVSFVSSTKPIKGKPLTIAKCALNNYIVTSYKKTKWYSLTKGNQTGWLVYCKLTESGVKQAREIDKLLNL